jgi:hypothetical protein
MADAGYEVDQEPAGSEGPEVVWEDPTRGAGSPSIAPGGRRVRVVIVSL